MSQLNTQDVRNLLEVVQTACRASIDAIAKTDLNGTVLWLRPPFVQCAIHETVYDRLAAVDSAVGVTLKVLEVDDAIQPGWQPIATAPRDGTSILTYPHYAVTSWASEDVYPGPGWADGWDESIERWKTTDKPTHWMPLPEPPKAAL